MTQKITCPACMKKSTFGMREEDLRIICHCCEMTSDIMDLVEEKDLSTVMRRLSEQNTIMSNQESDASTIVIDWDSEYDGFEIISPVIHIGSGKSSQCFLDTKNNVVWSFVSEDSEDRTKDIVSEMTRRNSYTHMPKIKRKGLGCTTLPGSESAQWYQVFNCPYYQPVTRENRTAYSQMNYLCIAWESFCGMDVSRGIWEAANQFITWLENETKEDGNNLPVTTQMITELQDVIYESTNWDCSYGFDFHQDNFKVDDKGTLIIIDPIFNQKELIKSYR